MLHEKSNFALWVISSEPARLPVSPFAPNIVEPRLISMNREGMRAR